MTAGGLVVIRTGVANLASVVAGLRRAGGAPEITQDPERVRNADHVMLPGVGTFGAAMDVLRETGLAEALTDRLVEDRPTMAICVGLQVLAGASAESPGNVGLGVIDATVTRFSSDVLVPQLGWNYIEASPDCTLLKSGYAYFANSFRLSEMPIGCTGGTTDHGGSFVSALERGALLACQCHPELSGAWGHGLLTRWLGAGGSGC
ncbi:MAG: glutamine amidotransferase [Myxococcota bacterium]